MIDTKIIYTREYDNVPSEGVLVDRFTHTNYGLTKDIALIFYEDYVGKPAGSYFENVLLTRPLFRYVDVNNDRLQIYNDEKSKYIGESKYDLMMKYCINKFFIKEYYIEDDVYNFVNYDGIRI